MKVDSFVRQQEQPELPSEGMQEKFESWREVYTLDALTNLSSSRIKLRRQKFEEEVQELLRKHRPGRLVANRPALAYTADKPPYKSHEWKRAREMIRNEAQKVRLRLEQAENIATEEQKKAKRAWIRKLVEALPNININLQ